VTTAKDRHGSAALTNDRGMGRSVYADSQPRDHHRPGPGYGRTDPTRNEPALVGGPARSNDRDRVIGVQSIGRTPNEQERRRQLHTPQSLWIAVVFERHDCQAERPDPFDNPAATQRRFADAPGQVRTDRRPAQRPRRATPRRWRAASPPTDSSEIEGGEVQAVIIRGSDISKGPQ
jgi:hypothetical protein